MQLKTALTVFAALITLASPSYAQIVQSSFVLGTEGWQSVTLPYLGAMPPNILNTFAVGWVSSMGGYIAIEDPDGTTAGNVQYWQAPAAFLGNKTTAYAGALQFIIANAAGSGQFAHEDVILVGNGVTLSYDDASVVGAAFGGPHTIPLHEGGWKVGGLSGPAATQADMLNVLSNLSMLLIRGEYQLGPDSEYLAHVAINAPVTAVSPTALSSLVLKQNIPNPFNPSTRVSVVLDHDATMSVNVFDANGALVRRLWNGTASRGEHTLAWDGTDSRGQRVASGVYYCRAVAGQTHREVKMVLLK